MIIPCIDLQDGKAVQLVQGKSKAVEVDDIDYLLDRFKPFPLIHVIDLNAAKGNANNADLVDYILHRAKARVGGGIRDIETAQRMIDKGATQVIIGSAAFTRDGINTPFLEQITRALYKDNLCIALDTYQNRITVKGWQESLSISAENVIAQLEPYCSSFLCTYVDKEGTMSGTNLEWFSELKKLTNNKLTAAGGFSKLTELEAATAKGIDVAIGMAIYTDTLQLSDLLQLNAV